MKPVGGIVTGSLLIVLAIVGGPLSVWQAAGRGEIIAAGAMLLIGIPLLVWMGKWFYSENWRIAAHRRRLRQNRPLRYYAGKTVRGLAIVGIVAVAAVDMMYLGANPATVIKISIGLLIIASMISVTASSVFAGAGDVLSASN